MARVFATDVGTQIRLVTTDDLSTATLKEIHIKKPDGTILEKTATLEGTGTLTYTTISGDLDDEGEYLIYGYVEFSTHKFSTPSQSLRVYAEWE